jgi:DNA helicase II / ATP-dependent DNA helicase PcrA
MAVFYRINAQSRVLEDGLRRRGIPYRIVGGTRFYDRREIRDVMAYLKLLVNPLDRVSLERIANIPRRGMGEKTLEVAFACAAEHEISLTELLERDELLERVAVGRNAPPLKDLARTWRLLKTLPLGSPSACVRGVIEMTGLEAHYLGGEDPHQGQERAANVREAITAAEQYHEAHPDGGLPGFLELVSLVTDADLAEDRARDRHEDQVTLMTLHSAKGLEFSVVFITGVEEGILPLSRMGEVGDLEEERRLMYVGITRAKEELCLSRARCRMQYGRTTRNAPSLFFSEIPDDCFEVRDATGRHAIPAPVSASVSTLTGPAALARAMDLGLKRGLVSNRKILGDEEEPEIRPEDPYLPGDRVIHGVFGKGEVLAMRGAPDARTIVIAFDRFGQKELQLSFCAGKLAKDHSPA